MSKRCRDDINEHDKQNKVFIDINELICPITREIFSRPVTANDGFTYEEWAISKCVSADNDNEKTSPITREPITSYCENKIVKSLVTKLFEINPELKKDQFDQIIYNDYLQNKEACIKFLEHGNFTKFSEVTDIRLLDYATSSGYIITHIVKKCQDIAIFKIILSHSFDLNCKSREGFSPMYYITKNGNKNHIMAAIDVGAEVFNFSNRLQGSSNIIYVLTKNNTISHSEKNFLINYFLENGLLLKIFIDNPSSLISYMSEQDIFIRSINQIIENECALYKLVGLDFIVDMINSDVSYDDLTYILDKLLMLELSKEKIYEYYVFKKNCISFPYISEHVKNIYEGTIESDNYDNDQKIKLLRKIKELLININVNSIDEMILKYNIECQHKIISNNNKSNDEIFDNYMNNK
ncbi:hypothetical protein Indivirus_8_4 [Indivirus ILV1]|uniref:U-box domain-containing protein n=1 Tax=Indivirus ILV1 TaxID=1977633 RepID=A0A1V0SEG4_9VIRU|nr:hypothetical protein Indivirus_8_4 [Indivirus ILV1]